MTDFDVVDCSVSGCAAPQNTLIVPQGSFRFSVRFFKPLITINYNYYHVDAVWSGMANSEWFVMVKSNDVGGVSVW